MDTRIPVGINLLLTACFLAAGTASVLLLPLILPAKPGWGLLLVPFSLATPTLWALIHEAIHGGLHPRRRWNETLGRALCILFGSPLQILRFGHFTHHRLYASAPERASARRKTPGVLGAGLYYLRILGGVYLAEVAASLLALFPRSLLRRLSRWALQMHPAGALKLKAQIDQNLLSPAAHGRLRLDGLLVICLYTSGLLLYGSDAWMLLTALAVRGAIVSFMDNLYHHTRAGSPLATFNLSLPRWASAAILYANLHAVHHRRPDVPWPALPRALDPGRDGPDRGFARASLHQLLEPAV